MKELAQLLSHDDWPESGTAGRDLGWYDVALLPLPSGELWVGDPGFSWAELISGDEGLALAPGDYRVQAFVVAIGEGNFVARLRVCAVNVKEPVLGEEIAEAGTDSAAIGSVMQMKCVPSTVRDSEMIEMPARSSWRSSTTNELGSYARRKTRQRQ